MSSCTGTYLFHDDGYKYRVPKKGLATITTSSDHEKETTILVRVYVHVRGKLFPTMFFLHWKREWIGGRFVHLSYNLHVQMARRASL
jgi:hypothetical protein